MNDEGRPVAFGVPFTLRRLAAGDVLFRQGERAFAVFEVASGRMRLVRDTIDNRPVVLHDARPGELFAEAALFAEAYNCDGIAAAPSQVRVMRKSELLRAFRRDPELAIHFMAEMAEQLRALRDQLALRNIRSARQRVLRYLALHVESDGKTVRVPGTLLDLAAEIGLTHEALYRTLGDLERSGGVIRPRPGEFRLVPDI
jgi:CRP-like cAMP-binding protein